MSEMLVEATEPIFLADDDICGYSAAGECAAVGGPLWSAE